MALLKYSAYPFEKAPDPDAPLHIVIARANTEDLDGDIFEKYIWKKDGIFVSPWGHDMCSVPAAIAMLTKRSDDAIEMVPEFIAGNGEATERAYRAGWKILEFSYAFYPTKDYEMVENENAPWGYSFVFKEVEIYEASGVNKGASIDTGIGKGIEPAWRKDLAECKPVSTLSPKELIDGKGSGDALVPSLTVATFKARIATLQYA